MKKSGISMLSLIITIIVIIILSSIFIFSGMRTPETAVLANFTQEVSSIRVAIGELRNNNLFEYDNAEKDFKRVILENAPSDFITFPNNEGNIEGYVIDLSKIDFAYIDTGKDVISGDVVYFDQDDVYVYDKNGTVYYAKGFEDGEKIYYTATVYRNK